MAAVKGANITNIDATPSVKADMAQFGGKLRVQFDTYEASGLAAASTITMARLPKGAVVHNVIVFHDDLGTTAGTLAVGDSGASGRFLAAFATGSAGKQDMLGTYGAIDGFGYEYTSQTDVIITTAGAAITGTIKTAVVYSLNN